MPIIGISTNKNNPPYTKADFLVWLPQFEAYLATEKGTQQFNTLYSMANQRVYKSIFGTDWSFAMALYIAHYMAIIADNMTTPVGNTLESIAGAGTLKGVVTSANVGGFSKTIDTKLTISEEKEALFWNQTKWGAQFYAILASKPIPSMFVVITNPIPGAN